MKEQLRTIWFSILLVANGFALNAQLGIDDIKSISITDMVNWNFQSVNSFVWEIKFNDRPELWYTKQISRAEFEASINKSKLDSLNLILREHRKLGRESMNHWKEREAILQKDYKLYCDTVTPVLINTLEEQVVLSLSNALLDTTYNYQTFIKEFEPADSIIDDLWISMTSYYPLVGVSIVLNSGDTLIAYCDGQGDLAIPWNLKHFDFRSFNPVINRALYAILPEEMSLNRKRLLLGISNK
jgi:hypothetical protein